MKVCCPYRHLLAAKGCLRDRVPCGEIGNDCACAQKFKPALTRQPPFPSLLPKPSPDYACTDEERAVLRRHFNRIDADGNGDVSWSELKSYYAIELGVDLLEFEVDDMMKEADFANKDSRIQFAEFVDIAVKCQKGGTTKNWKKVFDQFAAELEEASKRSRGDAFKRARF